MILSSSSYFKCCFDNAKKSLYKSFNAVFSEIGSFASADIVMHLLKSKCLPILMYGLIACPVNKTDIKSFDFAMFRILASVQYSI